MRKELEIEDDVKLVILNFGGQVYLDDLATKLNILVIQLFKSCV